MAGPAIIFCWTTEAVAEPDTSHHRNRPPVTGPGAVTSSSSPPAMCISLLEVNSSVIKSGKESILMPDLLSIIPHDEVLLFQEEQCSIISDLNQQTWSRVFGYHERGSTGSRNRVADSS